MEKDRSVTFATWMDAPCWQARELLALGAMWRTSKSAADSTGNRLPEESWAARVLVDAARDGNCSAVTRQLEEQNWPPHVLTRMGHASGCAALPATLLPAVVRLAALLPVVLPVVVRLAAVLSSSAPSRCAPSSLAPSRRGI